MVKWIVVMKIQPSICLDYWVKPRKKPQSGWSAPGFEPGTSRMWVSCVTTGPPRSVFLFLFLHFRRKTRLIKYRARWPRGNARDSHSGGPWFKSRCRPTWLRFFFVVFLNHQGKCWVGFSLPRSIWPLFIKSIYHKIKISGLNKWHIDYTTIVIHSILVYTQRP